MEQHCTCPPCTICGGLRYRRYESHHAFNPEGFELERCDGCDGTGIEHECDWCHDQREQDEDAHRSSLS